MTFPDRDRRWDIDEAVEYIRTGLRETRSDAGLVGFTPRFVVALIGVRGLGGAGDDAESNRGSEDLEIVVVHLVFQSGSSSLVETVELVEIYGVAIWHEQPMEGDGET